MDVILEGLPEEYNAFVMLYYGKPDTADITEFESLLLVQEAQLEKFRQELTTTTPTANVVQANPQPNPQVLATNTASNGYNNPFPSFTRGRYRFNRGRGRGRSRGASHTYHHPNYTAPTNGSKPTCQLCGKFGHAVTSCWYRFDESFVPPPVNNTTAPNQATATPTTTSDNSTPQACFAALTSHVPGAVTAEFPPEFTESGWYADTCASHHMTPLFHHLHSSSPYTGKHQAKMGNGYGTTIHAIGSSKIHSKFNPDTHYALNNLLHVPSLTRNLLSVGQFAHDNNVYFEFHSFVCYVKSQESDEVLLQGFRGSDGLFFMPSLAIVQPPGPPSAAIASNSSKIVSFPSVVSSSSISTSVNDATSYALWHHRLGHANSRVVHHVLNQCNVSIPSNKTFELCKSCCLGKSHKLYAPPSTTIHSKPFELIHSDLWGPSPEPSSEGYLYYIAFVDAHTKYTWIYFLKTKSEAIRAFTQFHTMIHTQFGATIKALQTDFGGEFRPFTNYLSTLGITHRKTCPYTSHQNGTVERKHRHITETGLSLLAHASMPLTYWDHSFTTAVRLINRLPTSALPTFISPYQALFRTVPDYAHLKSFGCACFPLLTPYNKNKLQFRSIECINLGLSPTHKGYKCLSSTGRIYISKDVQFHEHSFPFPTMFPSTSSSSQISVPHHSTGLIIPNCPPVSTGASNPVDISPPISPHITPPPSPSTHCQSHESSSSNESSPPAPALHTPPPVTNTHHMLTRAKTGHLKPRVFLTHMEPTSVKSAMAIPQWVSAMKDEYETLTRNGTWTLTELPPNRKAIGCKWVYRIKENADGTINKYKARLVAKGYNQLPGTDFGETFSPVIKPATIRILLTLMLTHNWQIQQIDINNAFINGKLEEDIYMLQPPGFISNNKNLVCKLHRSLYGLKQAPRAWYDRLKQALFQFGFTASKCDHSLFIYNRLAIQLYVLVYVDDILITGSHSALIHDLISKLQTQFALKHLGQPEYFLGIQVKYLKNGSLLLTQSKYISDLLERANMTGCSSMNTPMMSTEKLSRNGTDFFSNPTQYRSIVGALQYITLTRPDIAFSVNKVCQFLSSPLESHWKAVKRILRYLSGSIYMGLLLQAAPSTAPFSVRVYCDSDWASDIDDRRSTSGACLYLGPNLVSWNSKKQTLVARSSAEAEYRGIANATAELLWVQSLLTELRVPFQTPTLLCDNLSAVMIAHNPVLHSKTKHLEIDLHFVREKVMSKCLEIHHVPATSQLADALTKPLPASLFLGFRSKLKVVAHDPTVSLRGGGV